MLSVGALHLWYPFSGDQALFALGADELRHGRHLYTDFWDNKQPGIYWFFLAARQLLGPGEFAVHAVELAWLALLSRPYRLASRRPRQRSERQRTDGSSTAPMSIIGATAASVYTIEAASAASFVTPSGTRTATKANCVDPR